MTSVTTAGDAGMIHVPTGKRLEPPAYGRFVTTVTPQFPSIWQMVAGHALGTQVIVTGRAREACKRRNRRVIESHSRQERNCAVAGTTIYAGRDMRCRFATDMDTIVTGLTSAFLHHDMAENNPGKTG